MDYYEPTKAITPRRHRPDFIARQRRFREGMDLAHLTTRLHLWAGTGKPEHAQARAIFISVLEKHAKQGGRTVNANVLREKLTGDDGQFVINPQSYSAMFRSLETSGVLEIVGTIRNSDTLAGNYGKPLHKYAFKGFGRRHGDD